MRWTPTSKESILTKGCLKSPTVSTSKRDVSVGQSKQPVRRWPGRHRGWRLIVIGHSDCSFCNFSKFKGKFQSTDKDDTRPAAPCYPCLITEEIPIHSQRHLASGLTIAAMCALYQSVRPISFPSEWTNCYLTRTATFLSRTRELWPLAHCATSL
jgi:hypothetical protein